MDDRPSSFKGCLWSLLIGGVLMLLMQREIIFGVIAVFGLIVYIIIFIADRK